MPSLNSALYSKASRAVYEKYLNDGCRNGYKLKHLNLGRLQE